MSVAYDHTSTNPRWNPWSAEMDADLTLMRSDGKSSSVIADILTKNHGRKITRNSVIGRAARLGLERLKVTAPTEHKIWGGPRPSRHRFRVVHFREVKAPQPYAGSLNIPFLDTGPNQCREIVSTSPALCCGNPQTVASSYCSHHHAINHWVRP